MGRAARDLRGALHGRSVCWPSDHSGRRHERGADPGSAARPAALACPRLGVARLAGRARAVRALGRARGRGPEGSAAAHVPPRPHGVARVPRVRRHRARVRAVPLAADPVAWSGTASPARPPSSACCSPRSTLVLGSLWGKPVWGIWWAWDAPPRHDRRPLLPVPRLPRVCGASRAATRSASGKRNAIAALIAFVDVPIVHFSVEWWRTLHQKATVFNPRAQREHRRRDGAHALDRRHRVHDPLRVPARPALPARRARGRARAARGRGGDRGTDRAPRRRSDADPVEVGR